MSSSSKHPATSNNDLEGDNSCSLPIPSAEPEITSSLVQNSTPNPCQQNSGPISSYANSVRFGVVHLAPFIPSQVQVQSTSHAEPSAASPQVRTNLNNLENSTVLGEQVLPNLSIPPQVLIHMEELIVTCLLAKL